MNDTLSLCIGVLRREMHERATKLASSWIYGKMTDDAYDKSVKELKAACLALETLVNYLRKKGEP